MKSIDYTKEKHTFLIISYLFLATIMIGCKENENEIQHKKQITFDHVEVLYDVLPSGNYTGIHFTSQNTAYTITNNGKIFKTEDGGNTWIEQHSSTELHLHDIFFLNDLNGYIVGGDTDGIILKTTDGGNTWKSTTFQIRLSSIYFINETTGFASGKKLLSTQDGGKTWNEVDLEYFAYGGINFFDGKTGFLAAGNILLKTIDGGSSWEVVDKISNIIGTNTIGKIQINKGVAYLRLNGDKMYRTSDKGNTWQILNVPIISGSVHFINEHQAIGVGQRWYELGYYPDGLLCVTNDGGKHWDEKYFPATEFYIINDIAFLNDSTALAIGNSSQGCIIKLKF